MHRQPGENIEIGEKKEIADESNRGTIEMPVKQNKGEHGQKGKTIYGE